VKIKVERTIFREKSTIGRLSIDGVNKCFTLEDRVREDAEKKVYGETAIPAGTYRVTLRTTGTIHEAYLKRFPGMHKGTLWIRNIPGYEYVLIHCGNTPSDTLGCILVGEDWQVGSDRVNGSEKAYKGIYPGIRDALLKGQDVKIEIVNKGALWAAKKTA
jgi:hypothetical protein